MVPNRIPVKMKHFGAKEMPLTYKIILSKRKGNMLGEHERLY